jgi:ATP-binding cassette, subfamily B, bacterial PglK
MLGTFRRIFAVLDAAQRRQAALLLIVMLGMGLIQTLGVASIMPFMAVVSNPGLVETNAWLRAGFEWLELEDVNSFLVYLGALSFFILLASQLYSALSTWLAARFSAACKYSISTRLLGAYLNRPYAWFLNHHSADLGKTVLGEVDVLTVTAINPAITLVSKAIIAGLLISLVFVVDPIAAISVVIVIGGMYGIIYAIVRKRMQWLGREMYEANEARFKTAQESLTGIKDVKVLGLEQAYEERFRSFAHRHAVREASFTVIQQLPRFALEAIAFGALISIVLWMLLYRENTLGSVIPLLAVYAFAGYRLLPALQEIYANVGKLRYGDTVLTRIYSELTLENRSPSVKHRRQNQVFSELRKGISLRNICFTYPEGSRRTLENINIEIPSKSTVAFVGSTGSGKTTLVDIVLGLLEPDSGELRVDDRLVDLDSRRDWQDSVGYVPQQIFLTDDTVAANIALGQPAEKTDMAAVERAARVAELHDFVTSELPEGYQATVGERGVRLSGGQRQRIGIARALYHDPSVLILDEATSALDNLTEKAVMDAVHNLGRKKTVILIAHRLSTVRECDIIFLMNRGKIIASGTYSELVEKSPEFQAMSAS